MVNPAGSNPRDDFFAEYGKTQENAGAKKTDQVANSSTIDAASWLKGESRTLLDTQTRKEDFVLSFFREPSKRPSPEELSNFLDPIYTPVDQSQKRVNPRSESFATNQSKIAAIVAQQPNRSVFYSSKDAALVNKKNGVILIADHNHNSGQEQLSNFTTLRNLYYSDDLHLSTGFNEGNYDPAVEIQQLAPGYNEVSIINHLTKGGMTPSQALLYLSQQQDTGSKPNLEFLQFSPEKMTASSSLDAVLANYLMPASGIIPENLIDPSVLEQSQNIYNGIKNSFTTKGKPSDFYALLAARLSKVTEDLGLQDTEKETLIKNLLSLAETTDRPVLETFRKLQPIMQQSQSEHFFRTLMATNDTKTVNERNQSIAEEMSKQDGTKVMIIGAAHIDTQKASEISLVSLLEEKGMPVTVIA
jgi:hypothetical protein